nr:MAG TPA: hypothetical protein [Caudoviricetes sp.]
MREIILPLFYWEFLINILTSTFLLYIIKIR